MKIYIINAVIKTLQVMANRTVNKYIHVPHQNME